MKWEQLKDATHDKLLAWSEDQPWCRAMADCAQDAQWHSEGNVWTHTQMVLKQLPNLDGWDTLESREKTLLNFTTLFHDAGKPLTSRLDPVTGHITSPKHAVRGEHLVRGVLRDLGCDLATREQIAALVRCHGRPAFLQEREQPEHEVVRLSWLVNNRLLYFFALADTRGRQTESMTRPEENLHYWKLLAEDMDCYLRPYAFQSDHARFTFFRQVEPDLHYTPHEAFRCDVTLMCGLPGSGKDTWLAQHRPDRPVVSLDAIRREMKVDPTDNQGEVVQQARERCRQYLRSGKSFAFNATNIVRQTRTRWIDLFHDYNARIEVVYLEPPFDRLLKQNQNRNEAVPHQVIQKLATKVEPPTWLESHQLILSDG